MHSQRRIVFTEINPLGGDFELATQTCQRDTLLTEPHNIDVCGTCRLLDVSCTWGREAVLVECLQHGGKSCVGPVVKKSFVGAVLNKSCVGAVAKKYCGGGGETESAEDSTR